MKKCEKNLKCVLTWDIFDGRILFALTEKTLRNGEKPYLERYRSGHNEAVLKTVCPQGRVGSNPTLSACRAEEKKLEKFWKKCLTK